MIRIWRPVVDGRAWWRLISFFADHPWYLIFGIGYKTLPHTHLFGRPLIADNGFLSLTFEAGIIGLAAFLWLNQAVFSSTYRASRATGFGTRHLRRVHVCVLVRRNGSDGHRRPLHLLAEHGSVLCSAGPGAGSS